MDGECSSSRSALLLVVRRILRRIFGAGPDVAVATLRPLSASALPEMIRAVSSRWVFGYPVSSFIEFDGLATAPAYVAILDD